MKRIQIAFLTAAAAVILAGCPSGLESTPPDTGRLADQFSAERTDVDELSPPGGGFPGSLNVTSGSYILQWNINSSVGLDSIKDAVHFYNLTSRSGTADGSGSVTDVYGRGAEIVPSIERRAYSNDVFFDFTGKISASTSDKIMVCISAEKLFANTSSGLAKLDTNSNGIRGEDADDVYNSIPVTGGTAVSGEPWGVHSMAFTGPSWTESFTAATPSRAVITYNRIGGGDTADYEADLDARVSLEKQGASGWSAVSFNVNQANYNTANGNYTLEWNGAQRGDIYRIKLNNYKTLQTKAPWYGITQKIEASDRNDYLILGSQPFDNSDQLTGVSFSGTYTNFGDANIVKDENGSGWVVFNLNLQAGNTNGAIGEKGLKEDTITADTVKIGVIPSGYTTVLTGGSWVWTIEDNGGYWSFNGSSWFSTTPIAFDLTNIQTLLPVKGIVWADTTPATAVKDTLVLYLDPNLKNLNNYSTEGIFNISWPSRAGAYGGEVVSNGLVTLTVIEPGLVVLFGPGAQTLGDNDPNAAGANKPRNLGNANNYEYSPELRGFDIYTTAITF
jgi:hypothetical protein